MNDNYLVLELPEDNSMDIYSESGTKVVFAGEGGWKAQITEAKKVLTIGETYTVSQTRVGGFYSYVTLKEFPDFEFNTTMFNKAE